MAGWTRFGMRPCRAAWLCWLYGVSAVLCRESARASKSGCGGSRGSKYCWRSSGAVPSICRCSLRLRIYPSGLNLRLSPRFHRRFHSRPRTLSLRSMRALCCSSSGCSGFFVVSFISDINGFGPLALSDAVRQSQMRCWQRSVPNLASRDYLRCANRAESPHLCLSGFCDRRSSHHAGPCLTTKPG